MLMTHILLVYFIILINVLQPFLQKNILFRIKIRTHNKSLSITLVTYM